MFSFFAMWHFLWHLFVNFFRELAGKFCDLEYADFLQGSSHVDGKDIQDRFLEPLNGQF